MYEAITVIIILVCILLGAIVLIQNPKGGGLSATFGQAGNQLLGFQRSTDIVEKWTWGLAIGLLVLCLSTTAFIGPVGTNAGASGFGGTPQADPSKVFTPPTTVAPVPDLAPTDEPSLLPDEGSDQ